MAHNSQNSILRISDYKTLQLIELYEKEECLWNTTLEEYKSKARRVAAAQRIAKTLDLPHFTARYVITKFKNLRNSYCQELKKIAKKVKYRPKVFWFSKMDSFLRPHLQSAAKDIQTHQLDRDSDDSVNVKRTKDPTEEWVTVSDPEYVLFDDYQSGSEDADDNSEPRNKRSRTSSVSSKKVKTDVLNSLSQTVQDMSAQLNTLQQDKEDAFTCFGRYVTAMLKSMPPQKALELQPMIVSLLVSGVMSNSEGKISQSDETES